MFSRERALEAIRELGAVRVAPEDVPPNARQVGLPDTF